MYMDDIIESVFIKEKVIKFVKDIEVLFDEGNFKMKEWIFIYDRIDIFKIIFNDKFFNMEKVLWVVWNLV